MAKKRYFSTYLIRAWQHTFLSAADTEQKTPVNFANYFLGWPVEGASFGEKLTNYLLKARWMLPLLNLVRRPVELIMNLILQSSEFAVEKLYDQNNWITFFVSFIPTAILWVARILALAMFSVTSPTAFVRTFSQTIEKNPSSNPAQNMILMAFARLIIPGAVLVATFFVFPPLGLALTATFLADTIQHFIELSVIKIQASRGPRKPAVVVVNSTEEHDHSHGQTSQHGHKSQNVPADPGHYPSPLHSDPVTTVNNPIFDPDNSRFNPY